MTTKNQGRASVRRGIRATFCALLLGGIATGAQAWIDDQNADGIDDRIQRVHIDGLNAAFENNDPVNGRKIIAAQPATDGVIRYGVYVGYGHHPTEADLQALRDSGVSTAILHPYRYIDYVRMQLTMDEIATVAGLPGVTRVEAIPMVYPVNDIAAAAGGVFDSSREIFPNVRDHLGLTGEGVVVSILDTGVNDNPDSATGFPGHESLAGRFVAGGEFFSGEPALNTAIDDSMNPLDRGEAASSNHGTHVGGTAIGVGRPFGLFRGMAPGALLVDQKVLSDAGAGFGSADGVEWAIANKDAFNIRVLNLSLGGVSNSDGSDAGSQMMNAAFDAGLLPVIAMGNDGETGYVSSPAAADKALSIGSYADQNTIARDDDVISDFSNEGPRIDDGSGSIEPRMKPLVAAPGSGIESADGSLSSDGEQYKALSGTSMATPGVAGIIALLLEAKPDLTPTEVVEVLKHTSIHKNDWGKTPADANPFPDADPNYHPSGGWGRIDAYAAAKEVLRLAGDPASQVQVVRISATPDPDGMAAIDVTWQSQREIALSGYNVYRAPDVGGEPGPFTQLNTSLIPGIGSPDIERVNNRHDYSYRDNDSALSFGETYWYRIEHVSAAGTFAEPAYPVTLGQPRPVAKLIYQITHNALDNDLLVLLGTGVQSDEAEFIVSGQSTGQAVQVEETLGEPTTGNMRYTFEITLTNLDGVERFLPPGPRQRWFLSVSEGGFVNRNGQVDSFSMEVYDDNGELLETYTTGDDTPQRTNESQTVELWIPSNPNTTQLGAAPTVSKMDPEGIAQDSADVAMSVFGAQFQTGATVTLSGEGVTVNGAQTQSGSEITGTLSVAADAPPGPRSVTVTNVDGQSDTLDDAFSVILIGEDDGGTDDGGTDDSGTDGGSDDEPVGDTGGDTGSAPTPGGSGAFSPVGLLLVLASLAGLRRTRRRLNAASQR